MFGPGMLLGGAAGGIIGFLYGGFIAESNIEAGVGGFTLGVSAPALATFIGYARNAVSLMYLYSRLGNLEERLASIDVAIRNSSHEELGFNTLMEVRLETINEIEEIERQIERLLGR